MKFKNYKGRNEDWNAKGLLETSGLFGYDDSEESAYAACVANFNNHLLDEFKNDWRKIDADVDDDTTKDNYIGNRDYHHILKLDFGTADEINGLR